MFKNIQKYLLLNYPLLWNTKIVPLTIIVAIFHLIFFVIGYINGALNFSETENNYSSNDIDGVVAFFSVMISIIMVIIWLVFYFKNNSFKSFYPKRKLSLFKEWSIIFVGCFLICTFTVSYFFAKDLRVRNYFTEAEAIKRCETISLASMFVDGSFGEGDTKRDLNWRGDSITRNLGYYTYKTKRYDLKSLINKQLSGSKFFVNGKDSLNELRVKNWLVNNQKDSVKLLFKNYLALVKAHNLSTNIDENKWLKLTFNYPEFIEDTIVKKFEKDLYIPFNNYHNNNNYDYEEYNGNTGEAVEVAAASVVDSATTDNSGGSVKFDYDIKNQYIKQIGKTRFLFNKNFVPADELDYNYDKIAEAWISPKVDFGYLLFCVYFALGLSLIIFSYRLSSGKNWLIALISTGVLGVFFGILTLVLGTISRSIYGGFFREEKVFFIAVLLLTIIAFSNLIFVLISKKGKRISGITNNILLWLFPFFIPICYYLLIEFLNWKYANYDFYGGNSMSIKERELIDLLKDNYDIIGILNAIFIVLFILFLSFKIKKWKGVAES
jgi:hypothetical protein